MRPAPLWIVSLALIVLIGGIAAALSLRPANMVAIAPHEPVDLKDRIRIDGQRPEPLHGHLFLVGVTEREISMLQKLICERNAKVTLKSNLTSGSREAAKERDRQAILHSKQVAAAAAFQLLGEPVRLSGSGALVDWVDPNGPANGLLKLGDRIVRINNAPVSTSVDVIRFVQRSSPGTKLTLGVRRDNLPHEVTVRTGEPLEGDAKNRSRLGVALNTPRLSIQLPRKVRFTTDDIVGPSAGLAFAIGLYDAESAVDLLRGRYIVATGALSLDGEVQSVGGVRQKAIATQEQGYDLMVVPKANEQEAVTAIRQFCEAGTPCTQVLGVDSAEHAIELLKLPERLVQQQYAQ